MDERPINVRRSARVFAIDPGGRILLLRMPRPGQSDAWFTPGGAIEPDETTCDAAAARETLEEAGIQLTPAQLIGPPRTQRVTPSSRPGAGH